MFWFMLPLVIMTFAIGTEKYIIIGILQNIASDFNISLPDANLLVTYYVFGIAITGPLWIVLLRKVNKLYSLLFLTGTFIIGNSLAYYSSSYSVLLIARIISSFTHAPFIGISSIILSEKFNENGRAPKLIAMLFGGLTVANIFGVPMGTIIGQSYGWRSTFGLISLIAAVTFVSIVFMLKYFKSSGSSENIKDIKLKDEILIFFRKREVLATLAVSIFSFMSLFILITYMSVILTKISGFTKQELGYILSFLGVGMTLGSFVGGRFYRSKCKKFFSFSKSECANPEYNSHHFLMMALIVMMIVEFGFAFWNSSKIFSVFGLFIFGFVTFIMVPFTQTRIIEKAKDAPNVASTLNVASFNIGSGLGSLCAGTILGLGFDVSKISLFAIITTSIVFLLAVYNNYLDQKSSDIEKIIEDDKSTITEDLTEDLQVE